MKRKEAQGHRHWDAEVDSEIRGGHKSQAASRQLRIFSKYWTADPPSSLTAWTPGKTRAFRQLERAGALKREFAQGKHILLRVTSNRFFQSPVPNVKPQLLLLCILACSRFGLPFQEMFLAKFWRLSARITIARYCCVTYRLHLGCGRLKSSTMKAVLLTAEVVMFSFQPRPQPAIFVLQRAPRWTRTFVSP